jgi:hypothetical protein
MAMRFALIIGIFLTGQACALEQPTLVRVTCYWRAEGQLRAASNGTRLRNGHCAVDPKNIPYGSRIVLDDEELIAVDTGPAVVSRKAPRLSGRNKAERDAMVIDRYFETKSQAVAWEKSHPHFLAVRVVAPGMAMARSEKTSLLPRTIIAPPRITNASPARTRPEVLRPAIPIGDSYFRLFPGSSGSPTRNARRRTGSDVCFADVRGSRGRPLGHLGSHGLQIG